MATKGRKEKEDSLVAGGLRLTGEVVDHEVYPILTDAAKAEEARTGVTFQDDVNPEKFNFYYALFLRAAKRRDSAQAVSVQKEDYDLVNFGDVVSIPVLIGLTDLGKVKSRVRACGAVEVVKPAFVG